MISSVLSDGTIRRLVDEGRIKIEPWDPAMVQPASVDLKLGTSFRVFHNHRLPAIDLAEPPSGVTEHVQIDDAADVLAVVVGLAHLGSRPDQPGREP